MKRSITRTIAFCVLNIICAVVYVLSVFLRLDILEFLTFYGSWLLILLSLIYYINLIVVTKPLKFPNKVVIRALVFLLLATSIYSNYFAVNRTVTISIIVAKLAEEHGNFSFILEDPETGRRDVIDREPDNDQKIVFTHDFIDDYNSNEQYAVFFTYINLGVFGFHYKVHSVS
ncbi:hypothetical protein [Amphibacillus jilinensis]|uniref:hypothetical protein n=1 Tax=Amphibacillus jilinensis TaxID=1216008 RepID=UPI00035D6EF5|nr:hypothetical protein [Amphibacillus jilinensis]